MVLLLLTEHFIVGVNFAVDVMSIKLALKSVASMAVAQAATMSGQGSHTLCQFPLPLCYAHLLLVPPIIRSQLPPTMLILLCSPF